MTFAFASGKFATACSATTDVRSLEPSSTMINSASIFSRPVYSRIFWIESLNRSSSSKAGTTMETSGFIGQNLDVTVLCWKSKYAKFRRDQLPHDNRYLGFD